MKSRFIFLLGFLFNHLAAQTVDSVAIKQVDSLLRISRELTEKTDYDKALEVNATAEIIALEKLGRESAAYGSCCYNKGLTNFQKRDYLEAEKWYLEAKAIQEKALGKEHPSYAACLNSLGVLNWRIGNYKRAEPLYLEAKGIIERALGKEHSNYIKYLDNLASLYREMGIYEKAEPLFLEVKAIQEKLIGKEHPNFARCLGNLGILYVEMNNFEKAETYFLQAMALEEKMLGKEHPSYARNLHNLGSLYANVNNFEKAEPFFLEALIIKEKMLGKENPSYAFSLNNLAGIYIKLGNYKKAESFALDAKSIREKVLGKEHPDYSESLFYLANLYSKLSDHKKAELYFLEAKAIKEKILGKEHPDYSECIFELARMYERQNRFFESDLLLEESGTLTQSRVVQASSFLSEQELTDYTTYFQFHGNSLSAFLFIRKAMEAQTGILPNLAFDNALLYKGFLLTSASRLNSRAHATAESEVFNIQLKDCRRQLAIEYTKPLAERNGVSELEERANIAEKELGRSLAGYADAIRQVKYQEVKARLKKSEAAIEFVHFQVNFPKITDSIIYAALVVLPELEQPKFIPLFEEKSLDSLLNSKSDRKADYVNNLYTLADRGAVATEAHKKSLYEILWKPLEKEIANVNTIYFSPSGLLHRINLDAIPISETETLADKYNLIELNSTRQLVVLSQIKNANNDALLYGGIQYEQDSMFQNNEPLMASRSRGELSFSNVDTTLRGGSWNYLAGTEREVNAIEKIMQASGIHTTLKKGYFATEESFKNIGANNSASPRILHVATHGYFFSDPKENSKSSGISGQNEPVFKISDHPMLRSGLIMAGGNAAWQGQQTLEGREDGILTAYEISQMNLSNTELVVLSACETGLGEIQGNEGVYGLQRAFKIAGAKFLIMSLWQVPDKQTSLLMTTFYKKWLEDKMAIPDAFHAAQKELREIGLDPYQWAGFVLVE
jgi:CHAT domain-containing protein/Tfp pilus assembly protein PilF